MNGAFAGVFLVWFLGLLAFVGFWGVVIYVILHFLAKVW